MFLVNTEKRICDALLEMMEERPFYQIKVAQLCDRHSISRSTFYNYFDSIFSVLQKIEDDILEELFGFSVVHAQNDKTIIMDAFTSIRKRIRAFQILIGPNGDPSFVAKLVNRNKRSLDMLANKTKSQATTLELQIIHEYTQAGKLRVFEWWAEHENEVSVSDIAEIMNRIMAAIHEILW